MYFNLAFISLLLVTFRKKINLGFDRTVSNELKGAAILMVIFSHAYFYLFNNESFLYPYSLMAGVGVNIFLFLSGYGLTKSHFKNPVSIGTYYKKRLIRIYLPLWISLAAILVMDAVFLERAYPLREIIFAYLGWFPDSDIHMNINSPLWYVSLILFYYLIFPWATKLSKISLSALVIFGASLLLVILDIPVSAHTKYLYMTHLAAFPLGMIFASFNLGRLLKKLLKYRYLIPFLVVGTSLAIVFFVINSAVGAGYYAENLISMLTVLLLVFLFSILPVTNRFLLIYGKYSYQIYLIHLPILFRYNFFIKKTPTSLNILLMLTIFLISAYFLTKIENTVIKKFS